ncbi:MAG: DNA-binding protein [Deltaproteobacteria bacterium]|nr:DNA-binding protein [Deltaproteobacteria bacterium]
MSVFPIRLLPNIDLREELERITVEHEWSSGWIIMGIGSLSQVSLRFAGKEDVQILEGEWEICSLSGTLCADGAHLHMVVSDAGGQTLGGHVGYGNIIRTTGELIFGCSSKHHFSRQFDNQTGYSELVVQECTEPAC